MWFDAEISVLVALAGCCRRSHLHALELCSLGFYPGPQCCVVKLHLRFMSKTHMTTKGAASLRSVVISALPSEQSDVVLICPVRMLRLFVDRTDVSWVFYNLQTEHVFFQPPSRHKKYRSNNRTYNFPVTCTCLWKTNRTISGVLKKVSRMQHKNSSIRQSKTRVRIKKNLNHFCWNFV